MPRHRRYVSNEAIFGTFSLLLNTYQTRLTDRHRIPCQTRGMVLDKTTTAEVEVLLRLLVEMECEEPELVMQDLREAEREGRLH